METLHIEDAYVPGDLPPGLDDVFTHEFTTKDNMITSNPSVIPSNSNSTTTTTTTHDNDIIINGSYDGVDDDADVNVIGEMDVSRFGDAEKIVDIAVPEVPIGSNDVIDSHVDVVVNSSDDVNDGMTIESHFPCESGFVEPSSVREAYICYFSEAIESRAAMPCGSLHGEISRIVRVTRLEPGAMLIALTIVDKLLTRHRGLCLSSVNAARMALVSMLIGSKLITDVPYSNKYWAKISREFTLDDLNAMEGEFIKLVGIEGIIVDHVEFENHRMNAMASFH